MGGRGANATKEELIMYIYVFDVVDFDRIDDL
jgi:hypothetical protein